jgi:hypothetical protein
MPISQIRPAIQIVVLGHRSAIARDGECLFLGTAEKCAEPPLRTQEQADGVDHTRPQAVVVRLEHDPPRAFIDRALEEDEEPPHAYVLPKRGRSQRSRAQDADATRKETCRSACRVAGPLLVRPEHATGLDLVEEPRVEAAREQPLDPVAAPEDFRALEA